MNADRTFEHMSPFFCYTASVLSADPPGLWKGQTLPPLDDGSSVILFSSGVTLLYCKCPFCYNTEGTHSWYWGGYVGKEPPGRRESPSPSFCVGMLKYFQGLVLY